MAMSCLEHLDRELVRGADPLPLFRDAVRSNKERLAERFHAGEPVVALVHARAAFIDRLLQRIWRRFFSETDPLALIAVGGYGRGELHPASDVDLLILLETEPDGELRENLEQMVMFLWDVGLEVGHSVRTLAQCVEEAERDVTVVTNLMESRHLAGRKSLFQAMKEATGPDQIWPSDRFFQAKFEEQQKRHARYEESGYNLEPNIKGSPGGLRDIQVIGWVVKRHFGAETLEELVHRDFLTESEYDALMEGQRLLWKIRFALHLATGRHDDRLLFEYQRSIAREFGYCDNNLNLAVEAFMQDYYRTVAELNRLNEMLLQHFQEAILERDHPREITPVNRRFQVTNGFLEVTSNALFLNYPFAMLELFLILAEQPEIRGVRASTIRLVRAHLHLIDERFRRDIRSRSLFLE
ncbi:MAG TPA: [protein-PII] uridylyltransferase, partial [Chromatiaceae bacterium]|nr:[protein-PII] uridylyltransferase [Chromatiaceae bacterium]